MKRRRSTFSGGEARPQAIDPASGFKVDLDCLVRQWDNELVARKFVDRERNPQDYVRGIPDRMELPYARPEAPDIFMSVTLQDERGVPILTENNRPLMTEGQEVVLP